MRVRFVIMCLVLAPTVAQARSAEPGAVSLAAMLGPGIKVAPLLGGSPAQLTVAVQGEYLIDANLSIVSDLGIGLSRSLPLRFHAGARYRATLESPFSPYLQLQLTAGEVFNVLGANLPIVGARLGGGADYFLTREWSVGLLAAMDLTGTVSARPALFGSVDVLLLGQYTF